MGNTAYKSILGGSNISKNRGTVVKKNGQVYFLTLHPAATIYNPNMINELKQDMKKLKKIISKYGTKTKNETPA